MEPQTAPFWREETLAWYLRAAEHGKYHESLAERILPWLRGTVCDLGCGPGCLSLALLEHLPQVTAVDVDRAALTVLRRRAGPGLQILEADAMALPADMCWDTLVLSFFGRITAEGHLDYFLAHCQKRIVSIVEGGTRSSFSATGTSAREKDRVPQVEAYLKERGVPFHLEEHALEFGQPLLDLEDARAFVRSWSPKGCPSLSREELCGRLEPLEGGGYYLPYKKRIGIFVIDKERI